MSTFYNVRKSLIQAFRILFAAMLFVVAIGTVCPDIARAENLPEHANQRVRSKRRGEDPNAGAYGSCPERRKP